MRGLKEGSYSLSRVSGHVKLNGAFASKGGQKVKKGDVIRVRKAVGTNVGAVTRKMSSFELVPNPNVVLDVLYEDEFLAVINKPKVSPNSCQPDVC